MVNLNKSLEALEYIVNEHNVANSFPDEKLEGRLNVLDQEPIMKEYDETPVEVSLETLEKVKKINSALEDKSNLSLNENIYRLGLTKEEHAKVVLLSSLIAKRYNRHIGKNLQSEKLNNAFLRSKFFNNSLFYKMGFVIFSLIILQFKISLISLILVILLISIYLFSLYILIKTEKYIFKYISEVKNSMSEDLLNKKVNILELVYEIVRTKNSTINKSLKIRLKENYRKHIKEYKRSHKNIKIKHYVSYNDLLNLYKKDLYKKSVNSEDFVFRVVIEDIYKYLKHLEKLEIQKK